MRSILACLIMAGSLGPVLLTTAVFAQESQSASTGSVQNIVRVARSGGDYSNLNDAINGIGRASVQNPVLIDVAPGVFRLSEPVVLREHVHLRGSGVGITTLFGSFGGSNAQDPQSTMLRSFDNSTIHDLSIINKSSGNSALGIFHGDGNRPCGQEGLSPPLTIKSISVRMTGTANNKTGIKSECRRMRVRDISIEVRGGDTAVGLDMEYFNELEVENADIFIAYAKNIVGAHLFNNAKLLNTNIRTIGKQLDQGTNIGVIADSLESLSQSKVVVFRGTMVSGVQSGSPGNSMRIENNSLVAAAGGSIRSTGVSAIDTGRLEINNSRIVSDTSVDYLAFESTTNGFKAFGATFNPFPQLDSAGECLFSVYTESGGGQSFPMPGDCISLER